MDAVTLCECFARDGLQHEPAFVPTDTKRALVERFAALGFRRVEATSYSNPKVVPQFSDASDLLKSLSRKSGTFYKATCANVRAVERALADLDAGHGANEISLLVSATESHSRKNLNRSREAQWRNIAEMAAGAKGRFRLVGTAIMDLEGEHTGRLLSQMFPDREAYAVIWAQYRDAVNERIRVRQETLRWPDGDQTTYEVILVPLRDESGRVSMLFGLAHALGP